MSSLVLTVEPDAPVEDRRTVSDALLAFNGERAGLASVPLVTVLLRDSAGEVRGGLLGAVLWRWLHVDVLWVHDAHRGAGHGSRLLRAAEDEAVRLGCQAAHLDTFGFQARPFYEKHGYQVFGELPDYPEGHSRVYLWKRLVP